MKSKIKRSRLIAVLAASAAISLGGIGLSGSQVNGQDFVRPEKDCYDEGGYNAPNIKCRAICPRGYELDGAYCYKK